MKVSIVIPVFNAEKTIGRTLDTLLSQTMTDFEVIMVDDCSTDKSSEVCQHYSKSDSRFHYVRQSENMGPAAARNTGMDRMQGDYVTFIDSDDTVENNYLEVLFDAAKKSNADIVWCGFQYIYIETGQVQKVTYGHNGLLGQKDFFLCFLDDCPGVGSMWNKCYKTEFVRLHNLRIDEERVYGEDWDFNMSACLADARVFAIDDTLYNYFKYPGQTVSRRYYPSDYNSYRVSLEQLIGNLRRFDIDYPLNKLRGRFVYNIVSLLYKLAHSSYSKEEKVREYKRIIHEEPFCRIIHEGNWLPDWLTLRQRITVDLLRWNLEGLAWQVLKR